MTVVIAMTVIIAIAAFAIDVASWYGTRHKAQVTADAMALAAANYMVKHPSATASDGQSYGQQPVYTTGSGVQPSSAVVNVDTTNDKVTATVTTAGSVSFAQAIGIGGPTITATAVAQYGDQCLQLSGSSNCISLFAGNNTCPSSDPGSKNNPPSPPTGLDLVTGDSGGGQTTILDAFSNGYVYDGANSGSTTLSMTGVACSTDYPSDSSSKNATFTTMPSAIPYPDVWSQPTCTSTASYWTTNASAPAGHVISSPGVYCITSGVSPSACTDDLDKTASSTSSTPGAIYVGQLSGSGYEFVGPCVSIAGSTTNENIGGQPLVYGTSNTTTAATATALPTCTINNVANGSTYIDGNNTIVGGIIYDQCGTAVVEGNGASIGYVEAWNIDVLKNNVTGTGPSTVNGVITPSDQLIN